MDVIELIDKLTETSKALLDICCEQAKIIEMNDLVSVDDVLRRQGELESFRQILKKSIRGE